MRIACYSVAKNEEANVEQWALSCADADVRLVVDTGSTDDTIGALARCRVEQHSVRVIPWRFDDARNHALSLIPDDIDLCIALDLDETLEPGWRSCLEALDPTVTRPRYRYTWSWNDDGTPGLVYGGDKIHARHGYRWKHPVHEVLQAQGEEVQEWVGLEIHHHPDPNKSRSDYLPLLALAVAEDPDDDRNAHYYARELMYAGRNDEAAAEFRRHLSLPSAQWDAERAASMRYLARVDPANDERWLLRAVAEAPGFREGWMALAELYYVWQRWEGCYWAADRATQIRTRSLDYLTEAEAWGHLPHDRAGIAAWHLGLGEAAVTHGREAIVCGPADVADPIRVQLEANLVHYERLVSGHVDSP